MLSKIKEHILFTFFVFVTAAAGAFVQMNIIEHHDIHDVCVLLYKRREHMLSVVPATHMLGVAM